MRHFTFFLLFIALLPATTSASAHPDRSNLEIYINLRKKELLLIRDGEIIRKYPISAGTVDTPTPIGDFRIIQKSAEWGKGFGSRWLGLNVPFGTYGIHGTNKPHLIGRNVSHGCVRMRNRDVEDLFEWVELNTPVRIDGPILGREGLNYRILVRGSVGSLVQLVQNRLASGGYYKGVQNGIFDYALEEAVKQYQTENDLEITGQIHFADLVHLGIVE